MPENKSGINISKIFTEPTMIFAVFILVTVLMLIIPMPTFMLDLLMSLSLLSSVLIMLTVTYVKSAVEFSIFPSLLLVTTIFRLGVNVSSTKLILSKGVDFDGKMVRAFGTFVVGTDDASGMVIGAVIFVVITLVQFIVITKGSTRVSEVAARFALDSMPNKYMAIDMDVQNGVIKEEEALKKREALSIEAQFYGNMDGASKFVQGDVIVGIIITIVNIIGGFTVGMLVRGEDFNIALQNYIPLTIGDGLVSQIPSLLISTATGLIVTRSQSKDSLGSAVWKQIANQYRIFFISGGVLLVLGILPGFPHIVLLILSIAMFASGYALYSSDKKKAEKETSKGAGAQKEEQKGPENVTSLIKTDLLSLYIGYELIPLVDKNKGAELLNSITGIRRNLALDMGMVVPPIRIQDNMRLLPNEYGFYIRGQQIGKHSIKIGYLLAMGEGYEVIEGETTSEPAFGLPARWIKESDREKAESLGYTVVDPPTIISTHIQELIKTHCHEILGREETKQIIDAFKSDFPTLTEDVLKDYKMSSIQKILQNLLKEGVSIRDLITILETLSEHNPQTQIFELIEYVRQALKRVICNKYLMEERKLNILRVHPKIEQEIYKNMELDKEGFPILRLRPDVLHLIQNAIKDKVTEMFEKGFQPVIVTQPQIRKALWEICSHIHKSIAVLSTKELLPDVDLILFGQIAVEDKEKVEV